MIIEKILFLDIETKDIHLKELGINFFREDIKILGVGYIFGSKKGYFDYLRENNSSRESFIKKIVAMSYEATHICGHNLIYDLCGLKKISCNINKKNLLDTMILQNLINENEKSYSLEHLANKYLTQKKSKYSLEEKAVEFLDKKESKNYYHHLDKLPPHIVAEYCLQDLEVTKELLEFQIKNLSGLEDYLTCKN